MGFTLDSYNTFHLISGLIPFLGLQKSRTPKHFKILKPTKFFTGLALDEAGEAFKACFSRSSLRVTSNQGQKGPNEQLSIRADGRKDGEQIRSAHAG